MIDSFIKTNHGQIPQKPFIPKYHFEVSEGNHTKVPILKSEAKEYLLLSHSSQPAFSV